MFDAEHIDAQINNMTPLIFTCRSIIAELSFTLCLKFIASYGTQLTRCNCFFFSTLSLLQGNGNYLELDILCWAIASTCIIYFKLIERES